MDFLLYQHVVNQSQYTIENNLQKHGLIHTFETYRVSIIVAIGFVAYIYRSFRAWSSLKHIPTIGAPPGFLGYWRGMWAFVTRSPELIAEGYAKYGPSGEAFKLPTFSRYMVVITDPSHLEELRKANDEDLNFGASIEERMHFKWTIDRSIVDMPYHKDIVRKELTHRLNTVLPELMSEIQEAFDTCIDIGGQWVPVNTSTMLVDVIARVSNLIFVGAPLCRNKEYLDACLNTAIRVSPLGVIMDLLPGFLRPIFVWAFLRRFKYHETVVKHVGPIFDERRRKMVELGDKFQRPNDAIQWILEQAPPGELSTNEQLCYRILVLNFAAIHTSSISLLHIIYDLAAHPELVGPLREEVLSVLGPNPAENLTKQNLTYLRKLDSVLRESQRVNGLSMLILTRRCMKDYTFTSGKRQIYVPKGSHVSAPSGAIHKDSRIYSNPNEFDGFRFAREVKSDHQFFTHQMFVTTSPEYLPFGHGRHACPGRFFASNELKLIMIHILMNYDFRLVKECGGKRPKNSSTYGTVRPAMGKFVEFRRRK